MSNIFFDNWNKPWKELDFQDERLDASELAEDTLRFAYAEIGNRDEHSGVEFGYTDYIDDFHKAHDYINLDLLDDGWLTPDALKKIQKFYQEQLESPRYCGFSDYVTQDIEVDDYMGDDPHYIITISIPYDTEGTVEEVFDKYVNNFFACIQNVTDPGTWNEPYIFTEVQ